MTISLPEAVASQIDLETRKKGFATRSEFIRSLLRGYFMHEVKLEEFTPQPLEEIKKSMEKTGKYNKKFIASVMQGLSESSVYAR